jgi:membrane protein required for beta-lactamase induction
MVFNQRALNFFLADDQEKAARKNRRQRKQRGLDGGGWLVDWLRSEKCWLALRKKTHLERSKRIWLTIGNEKVVILGTSARTAPTTPPAEALMIQVPPNREAANSATNA